MSMKLLSKMNNALQEVEPMACGTVYMRVGGMEIDVDFAMLNILKHNSNQSIRSKSNQDVKSNSNQSIQPSQSMAKQTASDLDNVGQSCFMNTVLQGLAATRDVFNAATEVLKQHPTSHEQVPVIVQLLHVLSLQQRDQTPNDGKCVQLLHQFVSSLKTMAVNTPGERAGQFTGQTKPNNAPSPGGLRLCSGPWDSDCNCCLEKIVAIAVQ
jgi:hypothetical protein